MNTAQADNFFSTVTQELVDNYSAYWDTIKPVSQDDFLRRYLFAFTSVHTTWEANVRGYEAIKDLGWIEDKADLLARLIFSRCGMHNNRANYIWEFAQKFIETPEAYCGKAENWTAHRNELVKQIKGLGITKVSFALEMCFPNEAEISCLDTHGLQLYGLDASKLGTKKGDALYEEAEAHWLKRSKDVGASSTVARAIFWDKKQQKEDSRYWTYVLE